MCDDIEKQLNNRFGTSSEMYKLGALQIDESTDITGKAQLLAYIRIISDGKLLSEYFFCDELRETTTGEDIFDLVDSKTQQFGMDWKHCISICMDGARSMQGSKKGFAALFSEKSQCKRRTWLNSQRSADVQMLTKGSKSCNGGFINVVNFIKSSSLRSRIFANLCESMEDEFSCLLYHTEVRWLSKGKVLARMIALREKILMFFESQQKSFEFLNSKKWLTGVTFLNDVSEKLNSLNISMQGSEENILTLSGKLQGFKDKPHLWTVKIANRKLDCFPGLDLLAEKMEIYSDVIEFLKNLTAAFKQYFPNLHVSKDLWVVNPFVTSETNLNGTLEENLIDIRNDVSLNVIFRKKETSEFLISICE